MQGIENYIAAEIDKRHADYLAAIIAICSHDGEDSPDLTPAIRALGEVDRLRVLQRHVSAAMTRRTYVHVLDRCAEMENRAKIEIPAEQAEVWEQIKALKIRQLQGENVGAELTAACNRDDDLDIEAHSLLKTAAQKHGLARLVLEKSTPTGGQWNEWTHFQL